MVAGDGLRASLEYTELGHIEKVVLPGDSGKREINFETDELGRPWKITTPDGLSSSYEYNHSGRVLKYVDPAGRTTTCDYVMGRLTSVSRKLNDGGEARIRLVHNNFFDMMDVIDPLDRKIESYELDDVGRVVKVTNIETQELHITYGVLNFVRQVSRFDGSAVSMDYDGEGRLKYSTFPGTTNRFSYRADGLLETAENEEGVVTNAWNEAKRLAATEGPGPNSRVEYGWYPGGQVSNVIFAGGQIVYSNDCLERTSRIESPEGVFRATYNTNNGSLSECVYPNGIRMQLHYDVMDRITQMRWLGNGGTTVRSFEYSYDCIGLITNIARETGERFVYGYDGLDRLASSRVLNATNGVAYEAGFGYDLAGNRTNAVVNGAPISYVTGVGNRLIAWGAEGYSGYDAAGNVTSLIYDAANRVDLMWNGQYKVSEIRTNGILAERFGYDAWGRRSWIADEQATNFMIYSGADLLCEVNETGGVLRTYTYGPGIDNILAMTVHDAGTTHTYYYLKDHLGSVHALANEAGQIVEQYAYDAWGNVLSIKDGSGNSITESTVGNRILWQGREYSWKTGLYYFRARWYDPVTGRWLSKDPIGLSGGVNLYAYCHNDPINYNDPLGLDENQNGDDKDIGVPVPGRRNPPGNWPEIGGKWKWDKESGRYRKGGRYRHWHEDDRHTGHWDEENKDGTGHENVYPDNPSFLSDEEVEALIYGSFAAAALMTINHQCGGGSAWAFMRSPWLLQ